MDPTIIALIAISASLVGAVLGAVVSPRISAQLNHASTHSNFIRDQRREAYAAFTVNVEKAQRAADAAISGVPNSSFTIADLDELELARVKIDIFGSHLAKVWAYRCTLALIALEHSLSDEAGDFTVVELRRAKLHEARASLVRVLRVELGISGQDKEDWVSRQEITETAAEVRASRARIDSLGHDAWLNELPADHTALRVTKEAIAVYNHSGNAALGPPSQSDADRRRDWLGDGEAVQP
ncbi:hypothetical protein [Agromyces sp. ZXT2-3]|uniref:hypothetical protein n=1 Tax=Agromyces sp. ZXT2-3 TaxID=3461152 RepID=UPI00405510CE